MMAKNYPDSTIQKKWSVSYDPLWWLYKSSQL